MSNKRITDLTELTTPTTDDVFPVVDIATNTTTKVQLGNLPVATAVTTALATKQDTLVSGTNIKTLNSVSLLGSGDIVLAATPSGVAGAIQFSNGSAFASDATNFFWDDTNNRLGIGTNTPASPLSIVNTIALAAGATNPRIENIAYTINNTGAQTGTATGIFLNATETALNGQTHYLMDLQKGGSSFFRVRNDGRLDCGNIVSSGNFFANAFFVGGGLVGLQSSVDGVLYLSNSAGTSFGRIQLGGTTSSFPAIKRNGANIDFRLADDSNYCSVSFSVSNVKNLVALNSLNSGQLLFQSWNNMYLNLNDNGLGLGLTVIAPVASAIFEIQSTTKGFLPPRMTTTQKNAIATPAAGLVVYDSTTNKLCCYNGSTWNDLF